MTEPITVLEEVPHRELGWAGNVFTRELRFNRPAQAIAGHAHNFPHCHYVAQGPERITLWNEDGSTRSFIAHTGERVEIGADMRHEIQSLLPPADEERHSCNGAIRRVQGAPWCEVCLAPVEESSVIRHVGLSALGMCLFAARDKDGQIAEWVTEEVRLNRFSHEREGGGMGTRIF